MTKTKGRPPIIAPAYTGTNEGRDLREAGGYLMRWRGLKVSDQGDAPQDCQSPGGPRKPPQPSQFGAHLPYLVVRCPETFVAETRQRTFRQDRDRHLGRHPRIAGSRRSLSQDLHP